MSKIVNKFLAQMPSNTIKGNNTGGAANPIDLTTSQVLSMIGPIPIANGGTGSATQNFVDLSTNQTVAGLKSFSSALTMSEITTPSTPSSGTDRLYFKSDGNLYSKNSAGVENFIGGPGMSGTNWVDDSSNFSISNWGTITNYKIFTRRVGDSLQIMGSFNNGNGSASAVSLDITGYTIDSSKVYSGSQMVGTWVTGTGSANNFYGSSYAGILFYDGSSTSSLFFAIGGASNAFTKAAGSALSGSGTLTQFELTIPISGWSVNNGSLNGVIAANGNDQTPTGTLNGSLNVVKFSTTNDTNSAYNSSTGLFTCPAEGWYQCSAILSIVGTAVSVNNVGISVSLFKNGSSVSGAGVPTFASGTNYTTNMTYTVYCNNGDTLGFYSRSDLTSPSYSTFIDNSSFSIVRVNS